MLPRDTGLLARLSVLLLAVIGLSGCIAYTVVDTAASVVGTAVESTADVVGAGVDVVTGDDDDEED